MLDIVVVDMIKSSMPESLYCWLGHPHINWHERVKQNSTLIQWWHWHENDGTLKTLFYCIAFQTFAQHLYGCGWWIMPIFVALSTFGAINGNMMTTSRIVFVAGEERQMPRILALFHMENLTPMPAVFFMVTFLPYLSADFDAQFWNFEL